MVYCQSGHRSNIAAETLTDLGYHHVYNVTGSMSAWLAAGFPIESGRASSTHISTSSSGLPSLGVWVVAARADPDHGWKSDVGCGAAF